MLPVELHHRRGLVFVDLQALAHRVRRVIGAALATSGLPIGQMAIIGAVLIAGWFVLDVVSNPKESTGRYARGDAEMRKLLVD